MRLNFEVVSHLFKNHLLNRGFSVEHTIEHYTRDVRYFFKWLIETKNIEDLREVRPEDITSYRKYLHLALTSKGKPRFKNSTKQGILSTLHTLFNFLTDNDYILTSIFDYLDLKVATRYKPRKSISVKKMKLFLDSIPGEGNFLDIRDRTLFELAYGTGLRVGEITNLNLGDIDLKSGKLLVREGKGKKDRVVPIGANLILLLDIYLEKSHPRFLNYVKDPAVRESLFLTHRGNRMSGAIIAHSLKKRYKSAGLDPKEIHPHIIRHSFATHMLANGARLKDIKDILGHRSMQTTVIYTHFSLHGLRGIMKSYHPRENQLYEEIDPKEFENILKTED